MSLPLDEPLHAKFLRRPYAYGLSPLFQSSALANGVAVGLSVALAIGYLFWSGTIGNGQFDDRYANWGDYPGFWLGFYWHPDFRSLFAQHEYLNALQATTPLGIKGLYFLAAQVQIPFGIFQVGLISVLAISIAALSCSLTLNLFPIPLAGIMASFLSLQSLWSEQMPLVAEPKTWGYLGLLLCFCTLKYRGLPSLFPQEGFQGISNQTPTPTQTPTQNILTPSQPLNKPFTGFDWLKRLHWPVLSSIVFLSLFAPLYLFLVFGVFSLQVIDRLAIVPVGRKAQTVQEFLDWSKKQYSQEYSQQHNQPQPKNKQGRTLRARKRKKRNVEWQFQFRSPRLWDFYFPSLGLILGIGLIYGFINFLNINLGGEVALSRYEMLQQPAFYEPGLWSYFYENPWHSWLSGVRSGFIPPLTPPLLWSGLVLPFWLRPWGLGQLPLLRQVRSTLSLLGQLLLVSLICFVLAHAFVLQLGWPQDFVWVSHRLGLIIASSIFLTAIAEGMAQALGRSRERWWSLLLGLITLVIIVRLPFVYLTPPANALPVLSSGAVYDRLQATPSPKVLMSTLAFRENLGAEDQQILTVLQTMAPFYLTPSTLVPYQKSTYEHQRQQLKELLQAEYLAPRADFLAFVDRLTAQTAGEPLWLLKNQSFSAENWAQYSLLQQLYPDLNRQITQKLNKPGSQPKGFLETIVTSPSFAQNKSCCIHSGDWILVNLSKRCLPR